MDSTLPLKVNMRYKYFFLFFSAFLYGLSFMLKYGGYWCMVTALSLLFSIQIRAVCRAFDGFMWGYCAFFVHTFSLLYVLISIAHGPLSLCIAWLFLLAYAALYGAVWFFFVHCFLLWTHHWLMHCVVIATITTLFFMVMSSCFLFVFDVQEGYKLLNPLVVFVDQWIICYAISKIGIWWSLWWVNAGICCVVWIYHKNFFVGCLIFFLTLLMIAIPQLPGGTPPLWVSSIVGLALPFDPYKPMDKDRMGERVVQALYKVLREYPQARLIVMPESTLPFPLNCFKDLQESLMIALRDRECIVGSHYRRGSALYNCCYYLTQSKCELVHCKTHRMFFFERIPVLFKNKWCIRWFLKDSFCFEEGQVSSSCLSLSFISFFPLICSELFFASPSSYSAPLLCLVNDGWFKGTRLPELLYACAVMESIACQNRMLYVSHTRAYYSDGKGGYFHVPLIFA